MKEFILQAVAYSLIWTAVGTGRKEEDRLKPNQWRFWLALLLIAVAGSILLAL